MNYKVVLYIIFTFIAAYGISGINFNGIIKKDKVIEVRVLVLTLSFALGYLLTNFVVDFYIWYLFYSSSSFS